MDQITTPKILVVDDVEANRFALRDIIRQAGYTPVLTESGMQAIKVLERTQIDLVILDIAMPEMDGFEVCRQIKENVRTREIPIIFTSALDNPQDIKQGFACGGATGISDHPGASGQANGTAFCSLWHHTAFAGRTAKEKRSLSYVIHGAV